MKAYIVFSSLLSLFLFKPLWAFETSAIVRNQNFKAIEQKVILSDISREDCFEGLYFKIVEAKSDQAICLDHPSLDIKLKAATTYYHLTLARQFFVDKLGSAFVESLPQLSIRIELTNRFSELGHFANDKLEPQFNNALSIPAGAGMPGRNITPWGPEIWFRPKKIINIKELEIKQNNVQDYKMLLRSFRQQTHMMSLQRFLLSLVNNQVFQSPNVLDSMFRLFGASVMMEAVYQGSGFINNIFQRKNYWLDSALVPEIIYHEFAHIALSDNLELSHSSPMNEGMADFFAGLIANSPKLALKIKKHNTFSGKKATNSKRYIQEFETTGYANTDFVFGLLWDIKQVFGEKLGTEMIYALRQRVTTNSNLYQDLLQALLDLCQDRCAYPSNDRLKLYQIFHKRGF
jgi:hypothetical protein